MINELLIYIWIIIVSNMIEFFVYDSRVSQVIMVTDYVITLVCSAVFFTYIFNTALFVFLHLSIW